MNAEPCLKNSHVELWRKILASTESDDLLRKQLKKMISAAYMLGVYGYTDIKLQVGFNKLRCRFDLVT